MTSVRVVKGVAGEYISFECTGHAGYAESGEDIVCAAVSAATELVINVLEQFSVGLDIKISEKTARVFVKVLSCSENDCKREEITHVLDGYLGYIQSVAEEYPKNLKCIITQA